MLFLTLIPYSQVVYMDALLIDKYSCCFTETPGFCNLVTHSMNMSSEFRPKKFKAYRVPEKLKPALSDEIRKLLKLGFIEPIVSIAHKLARLFGS